MSLENRIHAVMAAWADAGDDVPEELKLIRELRAQRDELRDALDYLLTQTVDQDLKYGLTLSEGETEARDKAIIAIARAVGQIERAA